jgi:hypothetical protein
MLENSNYKLYYDKSIIKIELSIKIEQTWFYLIKPSKKLS